MAANPLPAIPTNSSGTEIGTSGAPLRVDPTGTTPQPATVADGANVTFGAQSDAAAASDSATATFMAFVKRLLAKFTTQFPAALTSGGFFKVSVQESGLLSAATLLSSAARTASTNSVDQVSTVYKRATIYVEVTAGSGFSITPQISIISPASSVYIPLWIGAVALTAVGNYAYYLADGVSGGALKEVVPVGLNSAGWRFTMTHGDATSVTYSIRASFS